MKRGKAFIEIWNLLKKNYYILIFFICIALVGFVSMYRLFFSKSTYVYARVKIGQGNWWASTNRSPVWFIKNIKKGDLDKNLSGQIKVQVLEVTYYPYYNSGQFDIYISLKLKVDKINDKYYFNRSVVGMASSIDLEFPTSQFSGTIVDFSTQPLTEKYEDRVIYLTRRFAYPWEYDAIKIGDKYFDGQQNIFEILDKGVSENNNVINLQSGIVNPLAGTENRQHITVKAKIRIKKIGEQIIFCEDQVLTVGKVVGIVTKSFSTLDIGTGNYIVAKIE